MSETAAVPTSKQLLHLVFGGEPEGVAGGAIKNLDMLDIVGVYPSYASAYTARKGATRYFITHPHRLLDPQSVPSQR